MPTLHITSQGKTYETTVASLTMTLAQLKAQLEAQFNIPPHAQRLISKGRSLTEDDATLESLKLKDGAKLMLMGRAPTEQESAATSQMDAVAAAVAKLEQRSGELQRQFDNDFVKDFLPKDMQAEALKKMATQVHGVSEQILGQLMQLDGVELSDEMKLHRTRRKTLAQHANTVLHACDQLAAAIKARQEGGR